MDNLFLRMLKRLGLYSAMGVSFTVLCAVFLVLTQISSDIKQLSVALQLASNGYRICPPASHEDLIGWLGAAYNARYMSLAPPGSAGRGSGPQFADTSGAGLSNWGLADAPSASEREQSRHPVHSSFALPSNYRRLLSPLIDDPHYYLSNRRAEQERPRSLVRRAVPSDFDSVETPPNGPAEAFLRRIGRAALRPVPDTRQWHCRTKTEWLDLGPDHFPRYVLTNRCAAERCWWNRFYCRPKNFAIKVLKRLQDKCVQITPEMTEKYMFPFSLTDSDDPTIRFREPWVFQEIEVAVCCECAP